jgi:WD40 repeat protein
MLEHSRGSGFLSRQTVANRGQQAVWIFRSICCHRGLNYDSRSMQKIRSLAITLGACLAFSICSRADIVNQPLRKFGLGDLLQVAISPDRQWMATAGSGGAFLWGFEAGNVLHRLEAHHARVAAICFSPNGEVLLTGGYDSVIRAWDVATGEEIRSFTGHFGSISDLVFAPDGQTFVSAGDNTARIWSLDTGDLLRTLTVPGASITHVLLAPNTNQLVTADGSLTNNVRVWDLSTGQTLRSFGQFVQTCGFTAGGHLVTGGGDLVVQVWDIETGQVIRPLEGATQVVVGLVTSTNNSQVTAGCFNGQVITWDASTGDVQNQFFHEKLLALAEIPGPTRFSPPAPKNWCASRIATTGTTCAYSRATPPARRWGWASRRTDVLWFPVAQNRSRECGLAPMPCRILSCRVMAPARKPPHSHPMERKFSPPSARRFFRAIVECPDWSGRTRLLWTHRLAADRRFSPDGQRIATGAQDGTARLWDVATGALIRTFASPGTWIQSVAVSSNGLFFASGDSGGIARLWNATNGQLLRTFERNAGSVTSLAFSPATGELLVTWADGFLQTFDPVTGILKLDSITPAAFLESAAFSPDGRFILGGEGWPFFTARLWDARTGEELRVFAGHAAPVNSVAFNASGTSILTGSDIVRLWSIADIAARLESERKPNGLELRWHTGVLQHSVAVTGPWNDVTIAASPWLVPLDQPAAFFRVRAVAED